MIHDFGIGKVSLGKCKVTVTDAGRFANGDTPKCLNKRSETFGCRE